MKTPISIIAAVAAAVLYAGDQPATVDVQPAVHVELGLPNTAPGVPDLAFGEGPGPEKVLLGGTDGQYVYCFTEAQFSELMGRIAKLETVARRSWNAQHSTEAGRVSWHGQPVSTTVEDGQKIVTYRDGYQHVTDMPKARASKHRPTPASPKKPRAVPPKARSARYTEAFENFRQQREDALRTTNEVHAVYGPGNQLISVEERK